jgi:hypothetical protein
LRLSKNAYVLKGFEDCILLLYEGAANACKTGHSQNSKRNTVKKLAETDGDVTVFVSYLGSMIYSLSKSHSGRSSLLTYFSPARFEGLIEKWSVFIGIPAKKKAVSLNAWLEPIPIHRPP